MLEHCIWISGCLWMQAVGGRCLSFSTCQCAIVNAYVTVCFCICRCMCVSAIIPSRKYSAFMHKDVTFRPYELPAKSQHPWTTYSDRVRACMHACVCECLFAICWCWQTLGKARLAAGSLCSSKWQQREEVLALLCVVFSLCYLTVMRQFLFPTVYYSCQWTLNSMLFFEKWL